MTTIYLSSTYEDLKEYREVVYKALRKSGYDVVSMEDYVAADQRPVEKCLDDVRKADIYVGIFGFRYGYVPPGWHGNPDKLSITELEFRQAEKVSKPCLTFVVNESTPWRADFMDSQKSEDRGERISSFRKYLLTEKMASSFSSPHELATLVLAAVTKQKEAENKTNQVDKQKPESAPAVTWDIEKDGSPYPGLMHFTRKYAQLFFGREAEVNEILDRMRGRAGRFMIISGDSGVGKSSVIDAGVLPRLEEGTVPGGEHAETVRMLPGQGNPFASLMTALGSYATRAGLRPDEIIDTLQKSPEKLAEQLRKIAGGTGKPFVLFLDQMEELFTAKNAEASKTFLSALYRAAQEKTLWVIATIRSDFLHHCHEHDDLLKVLRCGGHYPLGRMEPYLMRDIIVKPAQCAGLVIPEKLARRLIDDAGAEPGSLPLLAFVLERLFQERSGNELGENVYNTLGGIAGAIGAHVGKVEADIQKQLGADVKTRLHDIFPSLVVVNIDGKPTRRRTWKRTFVAELQPVIDHLSKDRLLSTEGEGQESTLSVAHEKLFDTWPSLRDWVAENRDDHFVLRQAEIEAKEWVKHGYDTKYLWHIDRLTRLRDIVQRVGTHDVDPVVGEYVKPQDRLIERLNVHSVSHQERLKIGQYLAALGDPRRGVGLKDDLPDIEWVDIPAGKVTLENVKNGFSIKLFRISRYLVTNIQFKAFVDAEDGYRNPEWWEYIEQSQMSLNSTWPEPNSPRTNVSWYEAVAFCRWLSARLSRVVRLPSEWEWQQAATAGDATNNYPWGPDWDAASCNSQESGLRQTTAVGAYPSGATKEGVLDMAGNVWEWCLNKHDQPDTADALRIDSYEHGQRVVRGGSWGNRPVGLHTSYRDKSSAGYRGIGVGFRLAQDIE